MVRATYILAAVALATVTVLGQDDVRPAEKPEPAALPPDPAMLRLREKLNPEYEGWSPEHTVERCAEHLATINTADRYRIRYFSMADVPRSLLPAVTAGLYYAAPSS